MKCRGQNTQSRLHSLLFAFHRYLTSSSSCCTLQSRIYFTIKSERRAILKRSFTSTGYKVAMFSSDNSIGGFHNDVLNAVPVDDESALKLIEEIKNRAKGCISSHNYPGAISLYTKAIEICPNASLGAKAILYSNRSLCHYSMSNSDPAIDDAGESINADPTYMKVF